MKTLQLFNAVLAKGGSQDLFVSDQGFIIVPEALWAKDDIIEFYTKQTLNGKDLNKTFHKSWKKIKDSTRFDLLVEQIQHYLSTYGSNFQDEIYIPDEVLEVPDTKLSYRVIKAYTRQELIDKSLNLLKSGLALKEETINDLITILTDQLGYTFTGEEGIRNKEAIVKIADLYGVLPSDTMEFFRYLVYRSTGRSLLIKNKEIVANIKGSNYNPGPQMTRFGLDRMATIFNRFKPIFLAFKGKCPATINKISKLSKKEHVPLVVNPLNVVTSELLIDDDVHWLDNATPFALFRSLSSCYNRKNGQNSFVYRVRNGKSFTKETKVNKKVCKANYKFLLEYLTNRISLSGERIFIPKGVEYALPTSEKMFVGNIPTGSSFTAKKLAVGMYWEDAWGARDLDLSGLNIGGKIGWNSQYNQGNGNLMYSGDITSAPNGAVEYLYANSGLSEPTLANINVYSGTEDCGYNIIVGSGDKISNNYMMNPDNLFAQVKCNAVQKQMVLGIIIPKKNKQKFVILNFGSGAARVSGYNELTNISTKALYQQWSKPMTFNKLVKLLGAEIVKDKDEATIDMSVDNIEKDTFVNIFSKKEELELVS